MVASTPFSVCLHEPAKECGSFKELKALWLSLPVYRGISDSGISHQLARIMKEIEPRTLIVDRDPSAVLASFRRYWGKPFDEEKVQRVLAGASVALKAHHSHPLVKVVKFEALADYDTAQECFKWLMPGNPHPLRRDLFNMRVNVTRESAETDAHRPHTGWHLEKLHAH